MKRMIARHLRRVADSIDPQPKQIITINHDISEQDMATFVKGLRRHIRITGARSLREL